MLRISLAQAVGGDLPAVIVIAVGVALAASLVAVLVSIRIARRMRAIGDAAERTEDGPDET